MGPSVPLRQRPAAARAAPALSEVLAYRIVFSRRAADRSFYGLKAADGSWRGASPSAPSCAAGPSAMTRRVFVTAMDNVVRAFDRRSGELLWHPSVPFRPTTGPVLLGTTVGSGRRCGSAGVRCGGPAGGSDQAGRVARDSAGVRDSAAGDRHGRCHRQPERAIQAAAGRRIASAPSRAADRAPGRQRACCTAVPTKLSAAALRESRPPGAPRLRVSARGSAPKTTGATGCAPRAAVTPPVDEERLSRHVNHAVATARSSRRSASRSAGSLTQRKNPPRGSAQLTYLQARARARPP